MLLTRLYNLNKAAAPGITKVTAEVVQQVGGMQLVTSSVALDSMMIKNVVDTFEDYEDMQAMPLADVKRNDPRAQVQSNRQVDTDSSPWATAGPSSPWPRAPTSSTLDNLFARQHHSAMTQPDKAAAKPGAMALKSPILRGKRLDDDYEDGAVFGDGAGAAAATSDGPVPPAGPTASEMLTRAASQLSRAAAPLASAAGSAAMTGLKATGQVAAKAAAKVSRAVASSPASAAAAAAAASAASVAASAASAAAAVAAPITAPQPTGVPRSRWIVFDDAASNTRYVMVDAAAEVSRAVQDRSDLEAFESYKHARVNRAVQDEARRLFLQLMPLVMEALEAGYKICFTGAKAGGSLASVLALLCVHRGLGHSAFSAVAFNAPPCVGEEADDGWCAPEGCTLDDEIEMLQELTSRGLMAEVGLPAGAIKSVLVREAGGGGGSGSGPASTLQQPAKEVVAALVRLAAKAVSTAGGEKAGGGATIVHRPEGSKRMVLFKPLGVLCALDV